MSQLELFREKKENKQIEKILLYALGEFQSRGFQLADRELALDRLLGAVKRAISHFEMTDLTDEQIAEGLENLGAMVRKVPNFVAKHPFRITVSQTTAEQALIFYSEMTIQE